MHKQSWVAMDTAPILCDEGDLCQPRNCLAPWGLWVQAKPGACLLPPPAIPEKVLGLGADACFHLS